MAQQRGKMGENPWRGAFPALLHVVEAGQHLAFTFTFTLTLLYFPLQHLHPAPPPLQPCCIPAQDIPSIQENHFPLTAHCPWATQVLPTDAQWPFASS